jgi:putative membrane protein
MEANLKLAKKLNVAAWIITGVVLILVGLMRRVKLDLGIDFSFLPSVYSTLNALTAVLLILAFLQIKRKNIDKHRKYMFAALITSVLFLLGYVLYHFTTVETIFGDLNGDKILDEAETIAAGGLRTLYLVLLATHVVLAAVIFPFILFTFIRGYTNQIEKHRKMAKWVFPLWLYVAVTGPILYLMLRPYYNI